MEAATFEFGKVLKEDGYEGGNILGCFFSCTLEKVSGDFVLDLKLAHDGFPIVSVREAYTNRLVDEKDVGIGIPGLLVEHRSTVIGNPAGAKFHEQP